ncbi:crotonase/enoyl-CoA hydratase family protein [Sneathiella aquimaris]|uniref:crotonase/enoyl-CoA hydratase family protein n=1 Tax=Sneathiella aquimaris TaxID=2599305 RepID=UPI00146D3B1C|nr:crotonase/enoyl-CoA hydratase family protein [Sneathiella aquimaris]
MAQKILIQKDGPITIITLNRPEVRNALDHESADLLAAALQEFDQDGEQRVGIITGAEGSFCAGADLKEAAENINYKAWAGHPDGPLHKPLSKPLIAAVSGAAVAGGLGITLYCDIRIADETAVFGVFCRRWGVPMSDGTPTRLPRLIGIGPAMDMMLTGKGVTAGEAKELGLVTRLSKSAHLLDDAKKLAHQIAAFPPLAMLSDRHALLDQEGRTEAEALQREMEFAQEAQFNEAQSGADRFAKGEGRHGRFH